MTLFQIVHLQLTFDAQVCAALVRVGLAGDLAGVLQLAAVDDELALLAILDDLDPGNAKENANPSPDIDQKNAIPV